PALAVAENNARALGVDNRAELVVGDWRVAGWHRSLRGPFDLIVSNPPYVEAQALNGLMPEMGRFEHTTAPCGGPGGPVPSRSIATAAPGLLARQGHLVVEMGKGQAPEIARIFEGAELTVRGLWRDLNGIDRVLAATH